MSSNATGLTINKSAKPSRTVSNYPQVKVPDWNPQIEPLRIELVKALVYKLPKKAIISIPGANQDFLDGVKKELEKIYPLKSGRQYIVVGGEIKVFDMERVDKEEK